MGRPKRSIIATVENTSSPPASLEQSQAIACVLKAEGNNLYSVHLPDCTTLLVELPARFRSTIWIKRGGYVVIDTTAFDGRANKLDGEIVNVVRDEKQWRKQAYWPSEFVKKTGYPDGSEEDLSTVGKMPPDSESDSDE
ncbi:MAG: nucleic acid-binding [Lasallia pustulata]|uniref:Nucleic acid-binding n=1 Tax=Lasallia pustulata TaxID=136370 RepID=A0A5M8PFQ5_9LECA|nr:MAG: nucleic acid-binding [Lasallia pustulata]